KASINITHTDRIMHWKVKPRWPILKRPSPGKRRSLKTPEPLQPAFENRQFLCGIQCDRPVDRCEGDYAAAGPYVSIDMTGETDEVSFDALYISPHKFIGGPGTPGVLAIKRKLLTNRLPSLPGGGTVSYVSPEGHTYLPAGESKEEGGTPAIVESIRAGMVFQLKDAVGAETIERLEHDMVTRAIKRWSRHPNIHILGDLKAPRISMLSFLIMRQGKPFHFGYINALLNDIFGIQARGGCSCAGPYGHELLNIDKNYSRTINNAVNAGYTILRPGWVRLNFNYFISEETFEYMLQAVEMIAEHGWKLFGNYRYDPASDLWICNQGRTNACYDLNQISFENGIFQAPTNEPRKNRKPLSTYIDMAEKLFTDLDLSCPTFQHADPITTLPAEFEKLRWYAR
ncbi:Cysteine desulfurase, partial [hydrothermal vent metagenome]